MDVRRQNPDLFSSLPKDVLSSIFDHFTRGDMRMLSSPFCKAVYPVQQAALYRDLCFSTHTGFAKLVTAVLERPHLGMLVKDLELRFGWERQSILERPAVERAEDDCPSPDKLQRFFEALVNLETLSVFGSSRIAEAVVTPARAERRFRHLEALCLHSSFSGFGDPTDSFHFRGFPHWPNLEALEYRIEREPSSIRLDPKPSKKQPAIPAPELLPPLPHLEALVVHGPLGDSRKVFPLVEACTGLTLLSIRDTAEGYAFFAADLLDRVLAPSSVTDLEVVRTDSYHPSDISSALSRFDHLTSLSVGGEGIILKKQRFFAAVQQLKSLEALGFETGCQQVWLSDLNKLVKGPSKHPTLRRLVLDNVRHDIHAGYFAEWTKRFSPHGLEKLLKVAEREGVEVDGHAVWALNEVDPRLPFDDLLLLMNGYIEQVREFALRRYEETESEGDV
ncbi:hypothetical protein JCM8097_001038 [Rhodosporidiobolus ruineniae]